MTIPVAELLFDRIPLYITCLRNVPPIRAERCVALKGAVSG